MSAQIQCPSWCEDCWEITPYVTKHMRKFEITKTWHPLLERWDTTNLTLESHTGPGAGDDDREPAIYFNMQNAGPDKARRVVAAIESALELIEQDLIEQEKQALIEQEGAR
ncbi:hypothetical protein [Georgenia sp. H159]|uniref:hypothetical protein n=1 Tax=Georgenia sp. H159 TaxID=3076115 RepID=UPI002D7817EF|nr:hypothetical protein [Georgenia sp. H159]